MQTLLIAGNVVDGLTFYGPFEDSEDAIHFAECNLRDITWWVTDLRPGCIDADVTSCPICQAALKDSRCPACDIRFKRLTD